MRWLSYILFACMSVVALAQFPGGGGRPSGEGKGEGRKGGMSRPMEKGQPRVAALAVDPIVAVERELPSLAVDLRLSSAQTGLWTTFEREVHDVANLSRMRTKRFLLESNNTTKENEKPATMPTALEVFTSITEDDRQKAEAMTDLLERLKPLYASLDDNQRVLFNRRILQAQREPLGVQ